MNLLQTTSQQNFQTISLPNRTEYTDASNRYIQLVNLQVPVLEQHLKNGVFIVELFQGLSDEQLSYRYASNKWTLKEVLVHLADDERIYAYRALRFARNDSKQLKGFDQEHYTTYADISERPLENILNEYQSTRLSTIYMYNGFSKAALLRKGSTDEWRASVRAILYHIIGHEINHLQIIQKYYLEGYTSKPNV